MSALQKCGTCGNPVSANAAACPGCGEPISLASANGGRVNMRDPVHVFGVALAAVAAGVFLLMIYAAFTGKL